MIARLILLTQVINQISIHLKHIAPLLNSGVGVTPIIGLSDFVAFSVGKAESR